MFKTMDEINILIKIIYRCGIISVFVAIVNTCPWLGNV
jgi:hypothetical protein